jgi:hypothetical protein
MRMEEIVKFKKITTGVKKDIVPMHFDNHD